MGPSSCGGDMNKMVALFPGQGAQHVGMAKELYENFAVAREAFEEASDAVRLNLRKLCFEGPESDLALTENTQPCLLTASVAAFKVAQAELGFTPSAVAGHSLGEYSALVAAGALPLSAAARWVRERGAAMQIAVPAGQGAMAAILGLEDEQVQELCKQATVSAQEKRAKGESPELDVLPIVEPANFNSPGQVVIAGSADGVAQAIAIMPGFAGGKAIPLNVSAPFHCRLMAPARDRMATLFSEAATNEKPRTPHCPYVPNRTARLTREPGLVFELLVEQIDHPVLWKQSVLALVEAGYGTAIEFGPGKVLQGLAKRIAKTSFAVHSLGDLANFKALESILRKPAV